MGFAAGIIGVCLVQVAHTAMSVISVIALILPQSAIFVAQAMLVPTPEIWQPRILQPRIIQPRLNLPTPVKLDRLAPLLDGYPLDQLQFLVEGFSHCFSISFFISST